MTLYFYADETRFEYSQNKNAYGYGVLITRYPVEQTDLIAEALKNLGLDPEPKYETKDAETLKNKYFHASEDSPNAKSYLCTSIKKYIQGRF